MPHGLRLTRTPDLGPRVDALAASLGERVGLAGVLGDLDRRARRGFAPGLRVRHALTWDRADRRTTRWWPQGVSTSSDASESGQEHWRRLAAVSWYARRVGDGPGLGSRVSFLDLDARRYRHVLLVTADGRPLRVHAGGLVWWVPHLHVAASRLGLWTWRLAYMLRLSGVPALTHGYLYVMPVR